VPSIFTISSWSLLPMLVHAWYAMFLGVFGDSLVSQRLGSVVFGLLSIVVVTLLGKELFSWRAGVIAGALLAVYHFHIHFSRVGIQVISGDVAVPLTLYLLVRTLRYGSRLSAVLFGMAMTLDIHAYFGSRICFIIVPIFLVFFILATERNTLLKIWPLLLWAGLGFLVSLAPMGVYILHNWSFFMSHTSHETIFSSAPDIQIQLTALFGTHDMVYMLRTSFWRTLLTLFYLGDGGLQYGIQRPMLDPLSAAFITPAVVYAVFRIRRLEFLLCLLSLISVLIIGGAITINMPYWPRLIVLLPILALLIAAFVDTLWYALEQQMRLRLPAALAALALFGVVAYGNYRWYFGQFIPEVRQNYIAAAMDVGTYLRNARGVTYAYGIANGDFYMSSEVVRFLAPHTPTCSVFKGLDLRQCTKPGPGAVLFFVFPGREPLIPSLVKRYPHGTLRKLHTYNLGQTIYVYRVGA
jgi:4-amino-4-deoxy-L-arabinose transferase-like glycosyltransferase